MNAKHFLKSSRNKLIYNAVFLHQKPKVDLNSALNEAEKIVGYPTSFLNLRWLLSDEIANVGLHLRKLLGTKHPLLAAAKEMFFQNDEPSWGLIVLLVSKAAGVKKQFSEVEQDHTAGILHSQRALAEVTEMIRTSNKLHKALLNYDISIENINDLHFGNKIALLSGDYLLSSSFHELACLKNHDLNELMSSALKDLVECDFIGPRDEQNHPLPAKPLPVEKRKDVTVPTEFGVAPLQIDMECVLGNAKAEWMLRNILGGASLLGKSCQGAMLLAGHDKYLQEKAYLFGRYLGLVWQAHLDVQQFVAANFGPFSLTSAPVLFHLEKDSEAYEEIEQGKKDVGNINYAKLHKTVLNGDGILKTKSLQLELAGEAFEVLKEFPAKDAHEALENIIKDVLKK